VTTSTRENEPCYADDAGQFTVGVELNESIARDTYRLRFHCPELAARIRPGQFLMVRLEGFDDPLIGRPFALYDTRLDPTGAPAKVEFVYLVAGKLTRLLRQVQPGQRIVVWGPLGNGFQPHATGHLIMVAGGIGQTPFLALGQEVLRKRVYGIQTEPAEAELIRAAPRVTLCYGARSRDYLAGLDEFRRAGIEVRLCTDDGTAGTQGWVTEVFEQVLRESSHEPRRAVCCGPDRMMHAVARIASAQAVPLEVSLETPMACGIGICFSCVARVRDAAGQVDYRRTCIEGPVFDAARIVWD